MTAQEKKKKLHVCRPVTFTNEEIINLEANESTVLKTQHGLGMKFGGRALSQNI